MYLFLFFHGMFLKWPTLTKYMIERENTFVNTAGLCK